MVQRFQTPSSLEDKEEKVKMDRVCRGCGGKMSPMEIVVWRGGTRYMGSFCSTKCKEEVLKDDEFEG